MFIHWLLVLRFRSSELPASVLTSFIDLCSNLCAQLLFAFISKSKKPGS